MNGKMGPDEFGDLPQSELAAEKIHKTLTVLKAKVTSALKDQNQDVATVKSSLSAELDQIKSQIAQLQASGTPPSEILDLEAQLISLDHQLTPPSPPPTHTAPTSPPNKKKDDEVIDKLIEEALSQNETLKEGQVDKARKLMKEFFESGKPLKEILNFSDDLIEALYSHAYHRYRSAKFKEAIHIFRLLSELSPGDYRFYFGIAACLHQQKDYKGAIPAYILASCIDLDNPTPSYHLADCQMELGFFKSAKNSLRQVISRGINNPNYSVLVDRARLTFEKLEKEHPESS